MSSSVKIDHVTKKFGEMKAVNDVSLDIKQGEFFTLLGPSGCGKTTLLRMIAGFYDIDEGEIRFGDTLINNMPAHKRNIGMVFQNYAIFPNMSVGDNVAYGLKARKVGKDEIEKKVLEALKVVELEQLKDRQPSNMSGGQQQRVALARAIVIEPGILLMDEPLSNLDAKLRLKMRNDIKNLQNRLGITTIYVTHDQQEALAVSDRIAVMNKGVVQQVGTPEEIYMKPSNKFVANFIGTTNFIEGHIENSDGKTLLVLPGQKRVLNLKRNYDGKVVYSIRPEGIEFSDSESGETLNCKIISSIFLGDRITYEVELENGQILEVHQNYTRASERKIKGQKAVISIPLDRSIIYDGEGKEVIV